MFFKAEIKKLFRFPLFWILLAVCLLLNCFVVINCFDFARDGTKTINSYLETGTKPIEDTYGFCSDYDMIKEDAYDRYYANFDIKELLADSQKLFIHENSPAMEKIIDKIYDRAAIRVEQIKANGEAKEEYYPGTTFELHNNLYGTIFFLILAECWAIGILMTSYLMKYEEIYSTHYNVYSTKMGRKIVFSKGAASVAATALASLILISATVLLFLMYVPQLGTFLKSSVSGAMATEPRGLVIYPFITWVKMSQLGYLLCSILVSVGYAVLSSLICFALSFLSKNAYTNALLTAMLYILLEAQWFGFSNTTLFSFIQLFNPSIAMGNVSGWFMEYVLNPMISYPGYETLVLFAYIIGSLLVSIPLWKHFKRKDMN